MKTPERSPTITARDKASVMKLPRECSVLVGRVGRGEHTGAADADGLLLAELRDGRRAAAQHRQHDDVPALARQRARHAVMRRRARSGGNADAGKRMKGDVGMERCFADRLDLEIADVAPVDLAPHRQALVLRKCRRRNVDGTEWLWIRQISRPRESLSMPVCRRADRVRFETEAACRRVRLHRSAPSKRRAGRAPLWSHALSGGLKGLGV